MSNELPDEYAMLSPYQDVVSPPQDESDTSFRHEVSISDDQPRRRDVLEGHHIERGTIINMKYMVLDPIGRGTSGIVYHAVDKLHKREVALKFYPQLSSDTTTSADNEVRALNHLIASQNCSGIYACPIEILYHNYLYIDNTIGDDGFPLSIEEERQGVVIVQELVCGSTLKSIIDSEQYLDEAELERRWNIFGKLLKSLYAINMSRVAHNDLHSDNMLWNGIDTRIIDFGKATVYADDFRVPFECIEATEYVGVYLLGLNTTPKSRWESRQYDLDDFRTFLFGAKRDWPSAIEMFNSLDIGDN